MTSKDRNKKTNVNHKLLKKIFGALEGVDIKQSKFVSKINNQKEINREASLSRNIRENKINYGKNPDYIYGTKSLNDQAKDLNPFTSALKK